MRKLSLLSALILAVPTIASAQSTINPACPAVTPQEVVTQDACQKAVDFFTYMSPQISGALSANPVVARGRISLTVSAGAIVGWVPQMSSTTLSPSGAVQTQYVVDQTIIPMPSATGHIRLFGGLPTPVGRVGAVSLLGSAVYLPDIDASTISFKTVGSSMSYGGGASIQVLPEKHLWPSIQVSGIRRSTPRMNVVTTLSTGDSVRADSLRAKSTTWRLEAGKHAGPLGLFAGFARDQLSTKARASGTVVVNPSVPVYGGTTQPVGPVSMSQDLTRSSLYGGMRFGLGPISLVGTAGSQFGGDLETYNSFVSGGSKPRPADQRYGFASLGLTIGF